MAAGTTLSYAGIIADNGTGSGQFIKIGDGTLTFGGHNTYTDSTLVGAGTLQLGADNALPSVGGVNLNGTTATLALAGHAQTFATVTMQEGAITGPGVLASDNPFDVRIGTISADLAGTNPAVGLNKIEPGTVILSGACTYAGTTTVHEGRLQLASTGSIVGDVSVLATGRLAGTGTVGGSVIAAADAIVAPGISGAGTLHVTGSVTLPVNSIYRVMLGATPARLDSASTVDITGSTLDASPASGFTPAVGAPITVLSSAGITGRFDGLPNTGDVLAIGAYVFQIAYNGGTGNDVTLTRIGNPATHFAIAATATSIAGGTFGVTVSALDSAGVPTQGYIGPVTLTATDAAGTVFPLGSHSFVPGDNGHYTFDVTLNTSGVSTITASDAVTPLPTVNTTVQVSDTGIPTQVVFRQQPTSTFIGTVLKPAVTAVIADQFGNPVSSLNADQVAVSLLNNTTGAILAGTATVKVANGVATFGNLSINKAGTYRLVAASGLYPSAVSDPFTVFAKTTTALRVAVSATTAVAGSLVTVTVTPVTAAGAIDASYRGTVHFTSTDTRAILPADYTFNGTEPGVVASFAVTLKTAGSPTVSVKEVQRGIVGSKALTVTAATTAGFAFTGFANPITLNAARSFIGQWRAIDTGGTVLREGNLLP